MNNVHTMVQHVAELTGRNGDARKLAVNGIQEGHYPTAEQPQSVIAGIEQPAAGKHQRQPKKRHGVW